MAGTYQVLVSTIGSNIGNWAAVVNGVLTSSPAPIDKILDALRHIPSSGNWVIGKTDGLLPDNRGVQVFVDLWSVDGLAGIPFNNLPAGFTVLSARVELNCRNSIPLGNIILGSDFAGNSSSTVLLFGANFFNYSTVPSAFEVATDKILFTYESGGSTGINLCLFCISGTYEIQNFTFTIETTETSPFPAPHSPNNIVILSSTGGLALQFNHITAINITFGVTTWNIPVANIITQTINSLIFELTSSVPGNTSAELELLLEIFDPGNPNPTVTIVVTGDGTQFSGTLTLGTFAILLENASGIYTIILNKSNDTLYVNASLDTVDVAIPNPFAKTGFIGG